MYSSFCYIQDPCLTNLLFPALVFLPIDFAVFLITVPRNEICFGYNEQSLWSKQILWSGHSGSKYAPAGDLACLLSTTSRRRSVDTIIADILIRAG